MNAHSDIEKRLNIASWKLRFFRTYVRRFITKNFHSVSLLNAISDNSNAIAKARRIFDDNASNSGPLIIAANHPSWWDPMIAIFLAEKFAAHRSHYAPIEDIMLERYGIFRNLGFYGIKKDSTAGLKDFIKIGSHVLKHSNSVIWMTPEGNFVDPRVRPVKIKKGLASLAAKNPQAKILPLALEYVFWSEKKPEILLHLGNPISLEQICQNPGENINLTQNIHETVQEKMQQTQEELSEYSQQRNHEHFTPLLGGSAGVGGFYGWWQRLRGYNDEHMNS